MFGLNHPPSAVSSFFNKSMNEVHATSSRTLASNAYGAKSRGTTGSQQSGIPQTNIVVPPPPPPQQGSDWDKIIAACQIIIAYETEQIAALNLIIANRESNIATEQARPAPNQMIILIMSREADRFRIKRDQHSKILVDETAKLAAAQAAKAEWDLHHT